MEIKTKYSSICRLCNKEIEIGELVDWIKGVKQLAHIKCIKYKCPTCGSTNIGEIKIMCTHASKGKKKDKKPKLDSLLCFNPRCTKRLIILPQSILYKEPENLF